MQKILLAANAHEIKPAAIDFACYIANLTHSPVTGIFLENKFKKEAAETLVQTGNNEFETTGPLSIADNVTLFENRCLHNDARQSISFVQGNPLREIVKESLYADVIITDGNTSFNGYGGWPSEFVEDLLENAKCPVIITPFSFDEINEIVFAYDGTDSSIFAMKQFIYLFPQLEETKITLLQVLKDEDDITEKEKLKSLLMMHYSAVHYDTLRGEAEMELFKSFLTQKNKLLVMGAYGRKKFFGHSTADILLKTVDIPIFITHY